MPATVEKLVDKPIAMVRYYGHVTIEDTRAVFAQIAGLVDTYGAPLYRITQVDASKADVSFDEVMMMTTFSSRGLRGSATDPDVVTVLAGDHPLIDLFAQAMREEAFGGVTIPIYDTEAEALEHVYAAIVARGDDAASAEV
jgi:hypothetical protein